VFTIGRGNDVQAAAIKALESLVAGLPVADVIGDLGDFSRHLTGDSPTRWLGPEKGVAHMAVGAVVNAAWDLRARWSGKPLWKLLADLSPEELVDLVDFPYIEDALTPADALDLLRSAEPGRAEREARLLAEGYPAYATTPGWLGYEDDKLVRLSLEAVADGFSLIKLKVGADRTHDERRLGLVRGRRGVRSPDRDRRQPGLERRGGRRLGQLVARARPVLDRGAHRPRRRARSRGDPPRRRPDPGRDR
jgi:L-fuconate dehydratase